MATIAVINSLSLQREMESLGCFSLGCDQRDTSVPPGQDTAFHTNTMETGTLPRTLGAALVSSETFLKIDPFQQGFLSIFAIPCALPRVDSSIW